MPAICYKGRDGVNVHPVAGLTTEHISKAVNEVSLTALREAI
jgi:hypothetical protein